jgi:hypothetical protein
MNRKNPARNVDRQVRAPLLTLIMVWPIMPQPPMPPKMPVTTLAMPWPTASRVLSDWVSVKSSTSFAVKRLRVRLDSYRKLADARCETLRARLEMAKAFAATLPHRLHAHA